MQKITKAQQEKIKRELDAYKHNFKDLLIIRNNGYFFIYEEGREEYMYCASSIQELKGWLYGAVQANNGIMTRL
ncbi:MAG: hypothetical protein ACRDBY_11075 [Cetobacterium sp.]